MITKHKGFPSGKRIFDLFVVLALAPVWIPVLALCALALLATDGRPVLYASERRVYGATVMTVFKFRTMRRDAERVFNRDTVPVCTQRFLNTPPDSPLYTPIGRIIERCMLTELPQLWHVIRGHMSLVGNRPLPVNVVESLREQHPDVDQRFLVPTGLTGPVQLVGRDFISDADRLTLEIAYVRRVAHSHTALLDIKILALTVAASLFQRWRLSFDQVLGLLKVPGQRHANPDAHARRGPIGDKPHSLS